MGAVLDEIGLARSVLAYVADADKPLGPEAPLTLLDGHLRQSELGDTTINVEVLDVNDAEANTLLLSLDPLAALAGFDTARLDELRSTVRSDSDALHNLWQYIDAANALTEEALKKTRKQRAQEADTTQFLLLIDCDNERHQVDLLRRFKREGLRCTAKMS